MIAENSTCKILYLMPLLCPIMVIVDVTSRIRQNVTHTNSSTPEYLRLIASN